MSLLTELKRRNVLRVAAAYAVVSWLIIQVVETVSPAFGYGDATVRLVVIVLAIGFIPALVLSWAFELTPDGLKFDRDLKGEQAIDPRRGKVLDRVIMGVLALALALFAFDRFVLDPARVATLVETTADQVRSETLMKAYGEASIAVLPFENMSADPEQAFFADGITEELLNLLARIEGLRVISRTSAFQYRNSDASLSDIARALDVAHVLEGSVRRSGNTIRITAQLIDARTDSHLWSETFDRELKDVFAIQDEVAARVVEQLKIEMAVDNPATQQHDPEAYALYLSASQLMKTAGGDVMERLARAEQLLLRAIELAPDYADAKVELSIVYWYHSEGGVRGQTSNPEAYRALRTSLLEDVAATHPDHAGLHDTLAWQTPGDYPTVAGHVQRALEREPRNSNALNTAMLLMTRLRRYSPARALGEYFRERDPVNYLAHRNLAEVNVESRDLDLAEQSYRTALTLYPEAVVAQWRFGLTLLFQGKAEAALEHFQEQAFIRDPDRQQGLALALHDLGRHDEAETAMSELIDLAGPGSEAYWPYGLARAYAWMGNADRAFRYLDDLPMDFLHLLTLDLNSPFFDRIRDDPRWSAFLERIGASPEQLSAVKFEVAIPR